MMGSGYDMAATDATSDKSRLSLKTSYADRKSHDVLSVFGDLDAL